jgi:hypothetical protein
MTSLKATHPLVWEAITGDGTSPEVDRMLDVLLWKLGPLYPMQRSGRWLFSTIGRMADEIEHDLQNGKRTAIAPPAASAQQPATTRTAAASTSLDFSSMLPEAAVSQAQTLAELKPQEDAAKQENKDDKSQELVNEPPAFFPDMCEASLQAEALERMLATINTSFKTDTGEFLLSNDLEYFYASMTPESSEEQIMAWLKQMKNEWESRLHSSVFGEFCEALDLWIVSNDFRKQA